MSDPSIGDGLVDDLERQWLARPSTESLGRFARALVQAGRPDQVAALLECLETVLDLGALGAQRLGIYEKERASLAAWKLPPDLGAFVLLVSDWQWLDEHGTRLVKTCVVRASDRLTDTYHVTDDDAGGPAVCWTLVHARGPGAADGRPSRLVGSVPCDSWHASAGAYAAERDRQGMAEVLAIAARASGASHLVR